MDRLSRQERSEQPIGHCGIDKYGIHSRKRVKRARPESKEPGVESQEDKIKKIKANIEEIEKSGHTRKVVKLRRLRHELSNLESDLKIHLPHGEFQVKKGGVKRKIENEVEEVDTKRHRSGVELYNIFEAISKTAVNSNDRVKLTNDVLSTIKQMSKDENFANQINTPIDENGNTILHLACQLNLQSLVDFLIEKQEVAAGITNNDGMTPLMVAVKDKNLSIINAFIDSKKTQNKEIQESYILHHLVTPPLGNENELFEIINKLLDKYPFIKQQEDDKGMTPAMRAWREGSARCFELLIKRFEEEAAAEKVEEVRIPEFEKLTDFLVIDDKGEAPIAQLIKSIYKDPDGVLRIARELVGEISNLQDVDKLDQKSKDFLLFASIINGKGPVVELLIKSGADCKNSFDFGMKVSEALENNNRHFSNQLRMYAEIAQLNIDEISQESKDFLLFAACAIDDRSVVERLIESGADYTKSFDLSTKRLPAGITALMVAAMAGNFDVATLLIDKGADPKASSDGFNLLHFACLGRNTKLVELFLDNEVSLLDEADLNSFSLTGYKVTEEFNKVTPLMLLISNVSSIDSIIDILSKRGLMNALNSISSDEQSVLDFLLRNHPDKDLSILSCLEYNIPYNENIKNLKELLGRLWSVDKGQKEQINAKIAIVAKRNPELLSDFIIDFIADKSLNDISDLFNHINYPVEEIMMILSKQDHIQLNNKKNLKKLIDCYKYNMRQRNEDVANICKEIVHLIVNEQNYTGKSLLDSAFEPKLDISLIKDLIDLGIDESTINNRLTDILQSGIVNGSIELVLDLINNFKTLAATVPDINYLQNTNLIKFFIDCYRHCKEIKKTSTACEKVIDTLLERNPGLLSGPYAESIVKLAFEPKPNVALINKMKNFGADKSMIDNLLTYELEKAVTCGYDKQTAIDLINSFDIEYTPFSRVENLNFLLTCFIQCKESNRNTKKLKEIIEKLLVKSPELVNQKDFFGNTPLMRIFVTDTIMHSVDVVKLLCDHGADPNTTDKFNVSPWSKIMSLDFTKKEACDLADIFLKQGININTPVKTANGNNTTLLMQVSRSVGNARKKGEIEEINMVRVLQQYLSNNANPYEQDSGGNSAISILVSSNVPNIISILETLKIENGVDISNASPDRNGRTLLHIAAESGNVQLMEYLINEGVSVDAKDNAGRSPLYIACDKGFKDVVILLIEKVSDLNVVANDDFTSLGIALETRNLGCAKALILAGAKVSDTDKAEFGNLIKLLGNKSEKIDQLVDTTVERFQDFVRASSCQYEKVLSSFLEKINEIYLEALENPVDELNLLMNLQDSYLEFIFKVQKNEIERSLHLSNVSRYSQYLEKTLDDLNLDFRIQQRELILGQHDMTPGQLNELLIGESKRVLEEMESLSIMRNYVAPKTTQILDPRTNKMIDVSDDPYLDMGVCYGATLSLLSDIVKGKKDVTIKPDTTARILQTGYQIFKHFSDKMVIDKNFQKVPGLAIDKNVQNKLGIDITFQEKHRIERFIRKIDEICKFQDLEASECIIDLTEPKNGDYKHNSHVIYCRLSPPYEIQDVNRPGITLKTNDIHQFKKYLLMYFLEEAPHDYQFARVCPVTKSK